METDSEMHLTAYDITQIAAISFIVLFGCTLAYLAYDRAPWCLNRARSIVVVAMLIIIASGVISICAILAKNAANGVSIPIVPVNEADRP